MRTIRTDLAIERREALGADPPDGVEIETIRAQGAALTSIFVRTAAAAKALGKPCGDYYTMEIESFPDSQSLLDDRLGMLTDVLCRLLPPEGPVARYHSLAADPDTIPDCLKVTARTDDGEVMAVAHREAPIYGVQFHPESILTSTGRLMLENFIRVGKTPAAGTV